MEPLDCACSLFANTVTVGSVVTASESASTPTVKTGIRVTDTGFAEDRRQLCAAVGSDAVAVTLSVGIKVAWNGLVSASVAMVCAAAPKLDTANKAPQRTAAMELLCVGMRAFITFSCKRDQQT